MILVDILDQLDPTVERTDLGLCWGGLIALLRRADVTRGNFWLLNQDYATRCNNLEGGSSCCCPLFLREIDYHEVGWHGKN